MSNILGFIDIENLNQEQRRINEEQNRHQADNAQIRQNLMNDGMFANMQPNMLHRQGGQAVVDKWTNKRKEFLKRSLDVKVVKHFPEKSVLTGDYGKKFSSRIKSDIKRLEKQRDISSRLYRKRENAKLIKACENNYRTMALKKLSLFVDVDQPLCDKEDLCDLAAFMDADKNKAQELVSLFLNKNEMNIEDDKHGALDEMLSTILSFNLENIRLDNDKEMAGNASALEGLTWKLAAFDRLSLKYRYFDQLDEGTKSRIDEKLNKLRSVSEYYLIRKDIITDPLYMSHYNDELSMDFTREQTKEQTALAQKLLKAHVSGLNMMHKNGASAKLINSKGIPQFKRPKEAETFLKAQEMYYRTGSEKEVIRSSYLKNAPMDEAGKLLNLLQDRKRAYEQTKQNSLINVLSENDYKRAEQNGNLYSGISEKQWKKSGGATYKKVMAKEDAERIVKKSKGFLAAVDAGGGLMELRPSLPEEVIINGKKVHLRKVWNLLIKASITMVTDEDGNFKTDEESQKKGYALTRLVHSYGKSGAPAEKCKEDLANIIAPVMEQLVKSDLEKKGMPPESALPAAKNQVKELCDELIIVLEQTMDTALLLAEVPLDGHIENLRALNNISDETMKSYLKGYKIRGYEAVKKIVDGKEVYEETYVEREATEAEIEAAVKGIRQDVENMKSAVKKLRELDVDGKEIPIPNTCSSNVSFFKNFQKMCSGKPADYFDYRAAEYIEAHPQKVLDYLKKNMVRLADANGEREADIQRNLEELYKLSFKKNLVGLSREERDEEKKKLERLKRIAFDFAKFEYHVAAHISNDDEDGDLTVEGFAAESNQFIVEPYTMHSAIGQYHGKLESMRAKLARENENNDGNKKQDKKHSKKVEINPAEEEIKVQEGFSTYYNTDNPFASNNVDLLKIYLNRGLKRHRDDFTQVVRQKEEAEAEQRRQQEEAAAEQRRQQEEAEAEVRRQQEAAEAERRRQEELERQQRKERERLERERIEREEKERKEQEEKQRLEKEAKEKLEQDKKKFEDLPSDPDAMDEFFIACSSNEYFKNKEDNENAVKDAELIKNQSIEDEINHYTGEDYVAFNNYLRDKDFDEIREDQKAEVIKLKKGLDKCKINRNVVVNRGVTNFKALISMFGLQQKRGESNTDIIRRVLMHVNDCQKEGKDVILTDPGFVSTCYDGNNKFTDEMMKKGIEFVIKVNKGTSAANISKVGKHSDEKELLLNAGTKFRLIKIYNSGPDDIEGLERRKATCDLLHSRDCSKKGECLKIYLETVPQQEEGILK